MNNYAEENAPTPRQLSPIEAAANNVALAWESVNSYAEKAEQANKVLDEALSYLSEKQVEFDEALSAAKSVSPTRSMWGQHTSNAIVGSASGLSGLATGPRAR